VLAKLPDEAGVRRARQDLVLAAKLLQGSPAKQGGEVPDRTITASTRGVTRVSITAGEQQVIDAAPKRVQSQIRRGFECGWFDHVRAEMQAGRNPAAKGWRHIMVRALLEGGWSRARLAFAFQAELGMAPSSAKVKVSDAVAIFLAGQLVCELNGALHFTSNPTRALS
jgi:hypothetical protein